MAGERLAEDQGSVPRCLIHCDKQYCKNSSRGHLKRHQRSPVLLRAAGRKDNKMDDIWLSVRPLAPQANDSISRTHQPFPLKSGSRLSLIGQCSSTHLSSRLVWITQFQTPFNGQRCFITHSPHECGRQTHDRQPACPCSPLAWSLVDTACTKCSSTHVSIKSHFLQVVLLSANESAGSGPLCRASEGHKQRAQRLWSARHMLAPTGVGGAGGQTDLQNYSVYVLLPLARFTWTQKGKPRGNKMWSSAHQKQTNKKHYYWQWRQNSDNDMNIRAYRNAYGIQLGLFLTV